MRRYLFVALSGLAFVFGDGCGSVTAQQDGGGDGGHAGGQAGGSVGRAGSGGSSTGGTGGTGGLAGSPAGSAGDGGGQGGGGVAGAGSGQAGSGQAGSSAGHSGGGGGSGGGTAGTSGQGGQSGGTGVAGTGGHGGDPADGGETCAQLVAEYATAFTAARRCTVGATAQCQHLAPVSLSYCSSCEQYVNDLTALTAIRAQWVGQGCSKPVLCSQIACVAPGPSSCAANAGTSVAGVCSSGVTILPLN